MSTDATAAECDGGFTCPAAAHVDGCFVWPAELLNAPIGLWFCPVHEHREHSDVTVEWREGVAYCTAADCGNASAAAVTGQQAGA